MKSPETPITRGGIYFERPYKCFLGTVRSGNTKAHRATGASAFTSARAPARPPARDSSAGSGAYLALKTKESQPRRSAPPRIRGSRPVKGKQIISPPKSHDSPPVRRVLARRYKKRGNPPTRGGHKKRGILKPACRLVGNCFCARLRWFVPQTGCPSRRGGCRFSEW